jgi:hypothetical protein
MTDTLLTPTRPVVEAARSAPCLHCHPPATPSSFYDRRRPLLAGLGLAFVLLAAAAALAGGWLALEVLLWGYVGVPCSRPLVSAAFRGRTLALIVGFELFCFESAAAQALWKNDIGPVLWQAVFFAVAAAGVHVGSGRSAAVNAIVEEHIDPRLDLEVVGPLVSKPVVREE